MRIMEKQLEYLNLEFRDYNKRRTIDDVEIYCFNNNHGKHRFHSENTHLNTISDICFTLAKNFDYESLLLLKIQKDFLLSFQKQNSKLESFEEKLDFLRNQKKRSESETIQQLLTEIKILTQKIDSLEKTTQKIENYIKSI